MMSLSDHKKHQTNIFTVKFLFRLLVVTQSKYLLHIYSFTFTKE